MLAICVYVELKLCLQAPHLGRCLFLLEKTDLEKEEDIVEAN